MNTPAKDYDVSKYERPSVTVDLLIFSIIDDRLNILLVKRKEWPFEGMWALPGGFVRMTETLDQAAKRELEEESGVHDVYLEQLYTFGEVERDPRTRVITVAYYALVPDQEWDLRSTTDVSEAKIFDIEKLPELAFDHKKIIEYGLQRLRNKIEYTNIAFGLLPEEFSLTELQKVHEIILGKKLDKRNFRKKILATDLLTQLNKTKMRGAHRPALLYKFKSKFV